MGGCVGTPRETTPSTASPGGGGAPLTGGRARAGRGGRSSAGPPSGKNVPLRHERIRWKSDMPLTESQVRSKREEFWDTAPAFEGRREIWDALKAAALAIETHDYNLAQAIVDGANITLPNGALTDCYDELGTRYQLPVYCLSFPLNILPRSPDKEGHPEAEGSMEGEALVLKVRLSTTSLDTRLTVRSTDTIATAKKKLDLQEGLEAQRQRWFYCGKLLGDRLLICECSIHPSFIIQAIIAEDAFTAVAS